MDFIEQLRNEEWPAPEPKEIIFICGPIFIAEMERLTVLLIERKNAAVETAGRSTGKSKTIADEALAELSQVKVARHFEEKKPRPWDRKGHRKHFK